MSAGVLRRRDGPSSAPAIDMGVLPDLLAYHLRCAHAVVFQQFKRMLGAHDISAPQFGTLLLIEANPGVSQSAVAEALRFDRSTLVQIVDRLEARGLVRRESSALDRRSHALKLTAPGLDLLARLKALSAAHEAALAEGLDDGERSTLMRLLERLYNR